MRFEESKQKQIDSGGQNQQMYEPACDAPAIVNGSGERDCQLAMLFSHSKPHSCLFSHSQVLICLSIHVPSVNTRAEGADNGSEILH